MNVIPSGAKRSRANSLRRNSMRCLDCARDDKIAEMALRFFNTYSREIEEFRPLDPSGAR